jgi:hypothetical protein
MKAETGHWPGGLAEWTEGDTAYLSIAFTWRLNDAYSRACWYRQAGYNESVWKDPKYSDAVHTKNPNVKTISFHFILSLVRILLFIIYVIIQN